VSLGAFPRSDKTDLEAALHEPDPAPNATCGIDEKGGGPGVRLRKRHQKKRMSLGATRSYFVSYLFARAARMLGS
jgi:hypothetical protein